MSAFFSFFLLFFFFSFFFFWGGVLFCLFLPEVKSESTLSCGEGSGRREGVEERREAPACVMPRLET